MFAQKPVLPVNINTEQKNPDALLMSFCKAEDPSQTKELQHVQQAKLISAKAKRNSTTSKTTSQVCM